MVYIFICNMKGNLSHYLSTKNLVYSTEPTWELILVAHACCLQLVSKTKVEYKNVIYSNNQKCLTVWSSPGEYRNDDVSHRLWRRGKKSLVRAHPYEVLG